MDKKTGIVGLLLLTLLPLSVQTMQAQTAQAQTAERGLKECIRMGIERNLSLKNARIGSGFVPSERAGKVVSGLRKHRSALPLCLSKNFACSRNRNQAEITWKLG